MGRIKSPMCKNGCRPPSMVRIYVRDKDGNKAFLPIGWHCELCMGFLGDWAVQDAPEVELTGIDALNAILESGGLPPITPATIRVMGGVYNGK